jgi:putative Mg2+ transporter-C (MgtC) family protein
MIPHWEMLLRITVAAILGGVIGAERDIHRRQAGLRTHLIVSMASGTFMVVSAHFAYFQHYVPGQIVNVDSSRIAASVVAGVGFLGGGSILRTGATVQGLTTAAGLWLVAAIGLCAGSGMYLESVYVTAVGLLALTVLRVLEDKNVIRRRVVLTLDRARGDEPSDPFGAVSTKLRGLQAKVLDLDYHEDRASKRTSLSFDILFPESLELGRVVSALDTVEGVREVQVRVP